MQHAHTTLLDGKLLIGRSEWCELSDLGLYAIKAKIDTGAKTSAIHAENIQHIKESGKHIATFQLHPIQGNHKLLVDCRAEIIDERAIMSSNCMQEKRYIIATSICMGGECFPVHISLSNREPLRYRLLLGRDALRGHFIVDPSRSCLLGNLTKKQAKTFYLGSN